MTNDAMATIEDLTITFERRLGVPLDRAWRAATGEEEMRVWFPSAVVGEREVGAPLSFPFDDNVADRSSNEIEPSLQPETGNASARLDSFEGVVGRIVALDPGRRIAYTWGESLAVVEWTIEPAPHGSRYRLTKHGMPETRAAGWGAGWHSFLLQLDMYMASGQLVVDGHEPRIADDEELLVSTG